ncbi:hypothetical protein CCR80_10460 [Rhodothalassium salexigens]|uniref:GNAT family N-acetyltransferase n=1 Tax=Rhodothalassium salexigens TaxID=1086 RepID=UPI0019141197|nr:hypothetical protein [Rhodothalassium salexigens]MBK5921450.1 hypothetical protein [Rhodothalassium salexigens]
MDIQSRSVTRFDHWAKLWAPLVERGPQPLQQSWGYGAAVAAQGAAVERLCVELDGRPVALAQTAGRRLAGGLVRLTLLMGGPAWIDPEPDPAVQAAVVRHLRRAHPRFRRRFLVVQPDLADADAARRVMRRAGLRRVMTGVAPVRLDLAPEPEQLRAGLKGKWRNALKGAEAADLAVVEGGARASAYQWLLAREAAQRGLAGYLAPPVDMVEAFAKAEAGAKPGPKGGGRARGAKRAKTSQRQPQATAPVLTLTALDGRDKLAGQLFLVHGATATYHIGWSGEAGRAAGAHNLLLWRAMLALKARGVRWLDLGPVDTAAGAGIARFKLGTGAEPQVQVGSWL